MPFEWGRHGRVPVPFVRCKRVLTAVRKGKHVGIRVFFYRVDTFGRAVPFEWGRHARIAAPFEWGRHGRIAVPFEWGRHVRMHGAMVESRPQHGREEVSPGVLTTLERSCSVALYAVLFLPRMKYL